MAKHLELPASQFSETLNGKANFSLKTGRRIAHKLSLAPREENYFCLLIQLETERSEEIRASILERIRELHDSGRIVLDPGVDVFRNIADWYHIAILELVNLDGFELSPERAARRLKISVLEARVAIERLERLGMLKRDPEGRWHRTNNDLRFGSPNRSEAMRAFYRQMLEKLSAALDTQETSTERLSGFETIPLAPEALPEIEKAMERFFEEAIRIARRHPMKSRVYHLGVHFFNLTQEPQP